MIFNTRGIWLEAAVFATSIIMLLIEGISYISLIRDALDMQHCKKQILRQIKMKYESLCRIGRNVNNTMNFVDKSLYLRKICGMSDNLYTFIRNFINEMCIVTAFLLALKVYLKMGMCKLCIEYVLLGLLAWSGIKMMEEIIRLPYQRDKTKVLVTDYLENQMYVSIMSSGSVKPEKEIAATNSDGIEKKEKKSKKVNRSIYTPEEERIIRDILEEYL